MYALVFWKTQNGIQLVREEVEVLSTAKLTVMNGGKMEEGATVNMLHKKSIWGGVVRSLHDNKKDADTKLKNEVAPTPNSVQEMHVQEDEEAAVKRKRKRKTYESEEESDFDDDDILDVPVADPPQRKKTAAKKKPPPKKTNEKKDKEADIIARHDEDLLLKILDTAPAKTVTQTPTQSHEHPRFGGKQPKSHQPPPCISLTCREEKRKLKEDISETRTQLETANEEIRKLQDVISNNSASNINIASNTSTNDHVQDVQCGKLPRTVGMANKLDEIANGVWCCPIKVKAAIKNSSSRTSLALALFGIFYPKDELKGRRLHELDADIINAITDFAMVAKLTKEPKPPKEPKEGEKTPPTPSRSSIKQALRMKCNSIICQARKKRQDFAVTLSFVLRTHQTVFIKEARFCCNSEFRATHSSDSI
ncbi:hypothetical protein AC249_AIPGENE11743 [Exaiptasia diaphana]|nr:hypothetical protein AC249_AIPGENE11743 [Exaiptasia diaphana]